MRTCGYIMFQSQITLFSLLSFGFTINLTCIISRCGYFCSRRTSESVSVLLWSGLHCSPQQHPLTESNSRAPNSLKRKIVEMLKSGSAKFHFFCAYVLVLRRLFLLNWKTHLPLAHIPFEFCPKFMAYLLFKFDECLFHCITIPSPRFLRPSILRLFSVY